MALTRRGEYALQFKSGVTITKAAGMSRTGLRTSNPPLIGSCSERRNSDRLAATASQTGTSFHTGRRTHTKLIVIGSRRERQNDSDESLIQSVCCGAVTSSHYILRVCMTDRKRYINSIFFFPIINLCNMQSQ